MPYDIEAARKTDELKHISKSLDRIRMDLCLVSFLLLMILLAMVNMISTTKVSKAV